MVVASGEGVPLGVHLNSAAPAEVKLIHAALENINVNARKPVRLIADKGYDSDPLRKELRAKGIELIAPNRRNHRKTQDGRPLRRYKRRWKIERTFAWLGNFRRLLVRHERRLEIYKAFFHIACIMIALRGF
jgi:transposase